MGADIKRRKSHEAWRYALYPQHKAGRRPLLPRLRPDFCYTAANPDGTYLHASLCREGQELFAISESHNPALLSLLRQADLKNNRPIANLGLNLPTEEEVRHAFSLLAENGTVTLPLQPLPWCPLAGEVVDEFGVYWYIYLQP